MNGAIDDAIGNLFTARAVRSRCAQVLAMAQAGDSDHFTIEPARLRPTAEYVIETIGRSYPDGDIPYHSRWRHFEAGGHDRWREIEATMGVGDPLERARTRIDLVVCSVLLDAGAGASWVYREPATNLRLRRSEGLAVASLRLFASGALSSSGRHPLRADARALESIDANRLGQAFQVSPDNPLVGLAGRVELLRRLGRAVRSWPSRGAGEPPRVGDFLDRLLQRSGGGRIEAGAILEAVLEAFGDIWPGRIEVRGRNLGDTWRHRAVHAPDETTGLVPFHKLSQWLSYSLVEPLETADVEVVGLDALTGLAEYRNGGLLIDLGVIRPRRPCSAGTPYAVDDEIVVEWRALTVALLDHLVDAVRDRLGVDREQLPLAKLLQGGTWSAGRRAAAEHRRDARPPLEVTSDGTVF